MPVPYPVRPTVAAACIALALVAGTVTACAGRRASDPACGGNAPVAAPLGSSAPGASGRPPSVPEALWVADGTGMLRAFDGRTDRVSATVDLGFASPLAPALLAGGGLVWAYQYERGVTVVDPVSARVTARAAIPPVRPFADSVPSYGFGSFWVAQPGRLWRVSASGAATSTTLPAGVAPTAVTAGEHWLWLLSGRRLVRVDPRTLAISVTGELPLPPGAGPLLATRRGLFVGGGNVSRIWTLDPDRGVPTGSLTIDDDELVGMLVDAGTGVWAIGTCGNLIRFVDGAGRPVQRVRISDVSQGFPSAAALGSLWVGDEDRAELVRVDLTSGAVQARLPIDAADPDDPAFALVAGQHSVWVVDANFDDGVARVDPVANRVVRLTGRTSTPSGISAVVAAPPR